jgi:hypothetical protein
MLAANVCASDFLQSTSTRAVPHPRGADAGEAGQAARVPQGIRPAARAGRRAARQGLRQAAGEGQGSAGHAAAADRDAAFAAAGGLQPGQRRPLRPRLRVLHALSPRRSGAIPILVHRAIKAVLQEQYRPGKVGVEIGMHCSHDRAPRRRGDARRRVVAQVLLHAGPHRRGVRRQRVGGGASSASLWRSTTSSSKAGAHLRAGAAIISTTTMPSTSWWRAHRRALSAWPTGYGCNWCGWTWKAARSISRWKTLWRLPRIPRVASRVANNDASNINKWRGYPCGWYVDNPAT